MTSTVTASTNWRWPLPLAGAGGAGRGTISIWLQPGSGVAVTSDSADLVLHGTADGSGLEGVTTASASEGPGLPWLLVGQAATSPGGAALFRLQVASAKSGAPDDSADGALTTYATGRILAATNVGDADFNGADDLIAGVWTFGIWDATDLEGSIEETAAVNYVSWSDDDDWITGVAPAGDFDEDGRADIAVLAEDWPAYTEVGMLTLVAGERKRGSPIDIAGERLTALGTMDGDSFGYRALPTGDFDDDGRFDLAITAPGADHGASGAGSIYLLPSP